MKRHLVVASILTAILLVSLWLCRTLLEPSVAAAWIDKKVISLSHRPHAEARTSPILKASTTTTETIYLPFVSDQWIPWNLQGALAKLPEVYTGSVTPATIDQYADLLRPLPERIQRWLVGMGWGLEDSEIDANEIALMELLTNKNVPTTMSILTNPSILGDVDGNDLAWAQSYEVENLFALLQPDIDQLVQLGLLSNGAVSKIAELNGVASQNLEIARALHLVASFGHPDASQFLFPVPDYNVALYVLGQLFDSDVPEGYELVALATALNYSSVYALGDSEVQDLTIAYAIATVSYIAETDQAILQQGVAAWQAKEYSLEASISLAWGAPGKVYPWLEVQGWWDGWRQFTQRPMTAWEFNWLFTSITSLTEMRTWLIAMGYLDHSIEQDPAIENDFLDFRQIFPGVYDQSIDRVMANLNDYFYIGDLEQGHSFNPVHFDYQFQDQMISVDGKQVHNQKIANPNWQWAHFVATGQLYGVCVDNAYMEAILARSINISSNIMARLQMDGEIGHTVPLYLNPDDGLWRTTVYDSYLLEQGGETSPFHYASSQTPLSSDSVPERVLFGLVANSSDYSVQRRGIPGGYIYRRAPNLRQPGTGALEADPEAQNCTPSSAEPR